MYRLAQLRRGVVQGVRYPKFFARELNRLFHRSFYRHDYNVDGVDVVEADWDTLVILDGCRYDLFERHHDLPGRLERRRSRGSHTVEFLVGNFGDRTMLDTVYVTASPQLHRWREKVGATFHAVIDVWREDGWDERHHTVLPETMTAIAVEANDAYPDKRLIVHYLQPHYPFIEGSGAVNARLFGDQRETPDIWALLNRGESDATPEEVRAAYQSNLDHVLPAVDDLLSAIDGRTVVTADHGNLLGERERPIPIREWGHPPGIHVGPLVDVPWLVYDSGPRRTITKDEPETRPQTDTHLSATERLADLGYLT